MTQHSYFWDWRDELADALRDENGLPPTNDALDVIVAVVQSTVATDERHEKAGVPSVDEYAADAEKALQALRESKGNDEN